MKKSCGSDCSRESDTYRLHYCGTCKSIGSIYDQKSRLLLNFDAVFLSELLSALSSENTKEWQYGYQSYNCFARIDEQKIPLALQYSAAANVFLSALKTQDHIHDERNFFWKSLNLIYGKSFKKAQENLSDFGLDILEINDLIQQQFQLEQEKHSLEDYAFPTAKITSLIFKKGGNLIQEESILLEKIGFEFGRLAYILDALEDYGKDLKSNAFNGIQQAFSLEDIILNPSIKSIIHQQIYDIQDGIIDLLEQLALPEYILKNFVSRLVLNVSNLLDKPINTDSAKDEFALSFSWKTSQQKAKALVVHIKQPVKQKLQYASLAVAIFVRAETLESLKGLDVKQFGVTATLATLVTAFACFAGKKQRKIRRRLKWLRNGFFKRKSCCNGTDCCTQCVQTNACKNCCSTCVSTCVENSGDECKRLLRIIMWVSFGVLILILLILAIIAA